MRGYTILELLVVLVLLALVTGLAMPRLGNLYESAVRAFELQDLLQQISGLGHQAYRQGKAYRLGKLGQGEEALAPPLVIPEGWSISADSPVNYRDNGVCTGGAITLRQKFFSQQWRLAAPLCQPVPYETD